MIEPHRGPAGDPSPTPTAAPARRGAGRRTRRIGEIEKLRNHKAMIETAFQHHDQQVNELIRAINQVLKTMSDLQTIGAATSTRPERRPRTQVRRVRSLVAASRHP